MPTLMLPQHDGRLMPFATTAPRTLETALRQPFNRIAFAAPHVVAQPLASVDPWGGCALDWDATIAIRRALWAQGLGVAEAIDAAQRGLGLDWPTSLELIGHAIEASKDYPDARLFAGCGTDQIGDLPRVTVAEVLEAYEVQAEAIEQRGGRLIIMASRELADCARSPDHYGLVYDRLLSQVREPVIIQWLGELFDPAQSGYWGCEHLDEALDVALGVLNRNAARIDGVTLSLPDRATEVAVRARLAPGIRVYTGDECDFVDRIEGDATGHAEALLGVFDVAAPIACDALAALAGGDAPAYRRMLEPVQTLARHLYSPPAQHGTTGVVLLAWLNGDQDHFVMVGGQQSARHLIHLAEVFRLADAAGLLRDPDLACARMTSLLATQGVS
ncbi:MAG: DUF993 family protein [Burkholderiales bacterium]